MTNSSAATPLKEARDLSREAPRSPRLRLGGYVIMARMIDKGRATIADTAGEYHFNCPVDNLLFQFKGVSGDEVRTLLESGATDLEVLKWFNAHGTPRSDEEIGTWSLDVERTSSYNDPEKRDWFVGECKKVGLNPRTSTLFDYLEADDRLSFPAAS